ncbi:hypothetical protein Tco_0051325 [Tanacetum coccineum]
MERVSQEAKLIKLSKPELIKAVEEVASKAGVDPKDPRISNGGKEFLKIQDAEYIILQREHLAKLKKIRFDQYVWNTQNKLKPEKIIDILIHPNIRPIIITIYMINDRRNFDVYKNFKFGDFGVSEWDELGEHGINPSLLLYEQDPSLSSSRKRKALELEPEVRIAGLECNRSLLEGIMFVNNKVIKRPEHVIFFIDAFGDQAFQRISDIYKVEVKSLLGYMVMAGNVSTLEYLEVLCVERNMIDEHLDKEKLKSNKVKLEEI